MLTPRSRFDRLLPLPEHKSYTMPSKLPLMRSETLLVSSITSGRWFNMSALDSSAVSVVLKSPMYLFSAGSAQTDAATISVTVLPPSVSPHRSTMNGSPPSRGTRTDANDAASISLTSIFPDARSFFTCRIQSSRLPYFEMLSYRSRKRLSPSNTTSVL